MSTPPDVSVADAYPSMAAFWGAMAAHAEGRAPGSIWDTYEAGERRELEARLAQVYGAPAAVVVCSGMGAVVAGLVGLSVSTGRPLEPPHWSGYFEIGDLFAGVLQPLSLVRASSASGVRLVEPIANEPRLTVNTRAFATEAAGTVVDNSLFSASQPWMAWRDRVRGPLCVVESIPKYIAQSVSGGVIFGERETVEHARQAARRLGILLNRHACRAVATANLESVGKRLAAHADNALRFAAAIRAARPDLLVRRPDEVAAGVGLHGACSSLVFVLYPSQGACLPEFERWARAASRLAGGRAVVRAGYGWPHTYGRAYGKNALNTAAGTEYLRFSVGLEPPEHVEALARCLGTDKPPR